MWQDEDLKNHIETSKTVKSKTVVTAEWNLNTPDNILKLGNYRYRPVARVTTDSTYKDIKNVFDGDTTDSNGSTTTRYYTNATTSDIVFDGGYDDSDQPQLIISEDKKMNLLYSLEDCLKPFRPRSGINKASFFSGSNFNNYTSAAIWQASDSLVTSTIKKASYDFVQRPRYYMSSKDDAFKYWTSYRKESTQERGVANIVSNGKNYIDDTAPFVVYKTPVFANRLVVKVQTNVGSSNLGPFIVNGKSIQDPLYGDLNKTTPVDWDLQVLSDSKVWKTVKSFDSSTVRPDGTPTFGEDGHLELTYGLKLPERFKNRFIYAGRLKHKDLLPVEAVDGYAWLIAVGSERGEFYVWNSEFGEYDKFTPEYSWGFGEDKLYDRTQFVTKLVDPEYVVEGGQTFYREVDKISGIRIVVKTMNKFDSTFDLIEMSPRLVANISDSVLSYEMTKSLGDLNNISVPIGQLLASNGSMSLLDYDDAFNENNTKSIISKYVYKFVKFVVYEGFLNVGNYNYYIPTKTLYSESIPKQSFDTGTVNIELRDMFFYFESNTVPEMLLTDISLSYAISILLDSIGFSNYVFKRVVNDKDPIIPYFFVAPNQNVAEVLNQLAMATQTAMFFDEYNNFIVMSKNYLTAEASERSVDAVMVGSDYVDESGKTVEPNIISIDSSDKLVFNDGTVNYSEKYIQRSYGTINQSTMVDSDKTWIYKPVLLWEASGTDITKTINEKANEMGKYVLGAYPLKTTIPVEPPTVVENILTKNTIDVGENIYWLTRYNGYLYSNGEIIKYDAAQFTVSGTKTESGNILPVGNVWISDNEEYQEYFSKIPHGGKMWPTGLIRIYSKPFYETVAGITKMKNGPVEEHGRAQFGTEITSHPAGLDTYWSDNSNTYGCIMDTSFIFGTDPNPVMPNLDKSGVAGDNSVVARQSHRNGIIKNFMSSSNRTETGVAQLKSVEAGTLQSSALVFSGPTFATGQKPIETISYVYKDLSSQQSVQKFKHFGTRCRIIGKIETSIENPQTPTGATVYYNVPPKFSDQTITINGGGGGLGVLVNKTNNTGYYFELSAFTVKNIADYMQTDDEGNATSSINNVIFYKVNKKAGASNTDKAIPTKLWGGIANVVVDDGRFTGQARQAGEENPSVYDLAVEYKDLSPTQRRFFLYINNVLVKVVDDFDPLPAYTGMCLFVRGSSKLMFENIYALADNYSDNNSFTIANTIADAFGDKEINATEGLRKYALSGMIQASHLSEVGSTKPPGFSIYFDEFGTILRECAYFDIKYDKAYPALWAKLSPTFNRIKSYTTSGFVANAYGAEFLIFNATDAAINLDETTGNYLRIQGITFTQDTRNELSVDKYFEKVGSFSDPEMSGTTVLKDPNIQDSLYNEIKVSRMTHGVKAFTIESPYIQTSDHAKNIMEWAIKKTMKPKKNVSLKIFSNPMLQLGDIVRVVAKQNDFERLGSSDARYVIYNIAQSKGGEGPEQTLFLCEI